MSQRHPFPRAYLVLLAALAALSLAALRPQPVLRAERIELLTPGGTTGATLTADSAGMTITLLDPRGRPVGALRLNGEPWLSVQGGDGREAAGLGRPKVHRLGE